MTSKGGQGSSRITALEAVAWALWLQVFCSALLAQMAPVRFILIATLAVGAATLSFAATTARARRLPGISLTLAFLAAGALLVLTRTSLLPTADPVLQERVVRYFVLLPLALASGVLSVQANCARTMLAPLRTLGLTFALLACAERTLGRALWVQAPIIQRGGEQRAIVFSEHPIVLGVLLLAALAVLSDEHRPIRKVLCQVIVVLGIYSTGSRGPLLMALLFLAWHYGTLLRGPRFRALAIVASSLSFFLFFTVGSMLIWDPIVTGTDEASISASYRYGIYATVPQQVYSHPGGLGIFGLPSSTLWIPTPGGPVDIAESIDSEPVLLAYELGYFGLLMFLIIWYVNTIAAIRGEWATTAGLLVTLAGLTVAIHSWTSAGPMWTLLTGMSLATLRSRTRNRGTAPVNKEV
jgi:hypothetical protein